MEKSLEHPDFRKKRFTVKSLCQQLNISRQAFYKKREHLQKQLYQEELIVQKVLSIRKLMPRIGGRKLFYMIKHSGIPFNIGRDKFFEILKKHQLLVKPRKQYIRTTNSSHFFRVYSNLIKAMEASYPGQVLVSDITYIKIVGAFCYLFLVTDLYSRKILGYYLSKSLEASDALVALNRALEKIENPAGSIHHSDRGIQYCSSEYVKLLKDSDMLISMGEAGNPYENAVAERVNGILKQEFLLNTTFSDYRSAKVAVDEAVNIYNCLRPHLSLNYSTPEQKYVA